MTSEEIKSHLESIMFARHGLGHDHCREEVSGFFLILTCLHKTAPCRRLWPKLHGRLDLGIFDHDFQCWLRCKRLACAGRTLHNGYLFREDPLTCLHLGCIHFRCWDCWKLAKNLGVEQGWWLASSFLKWGGSLLVWAESGLTGTTSASY